MVEIFDAIEHMIDLSRDDLSIVVNRGKYQMYTTTPPELYMIRVYNDQPAEQIRQKFSSEAHVLSILSNHDVIPSPTLISTHLTSSHLILIMEKLDGISLHEAWPYFSSEDKLQLSTQLGKILGDLHDISKTGYGFPDNPQDRWTDYILQRIEIGLQHLSHSLSETLLRKIRRYVDDWLPAITSARPVIVHGDLNPHNILISSLDDEPRISGIIDWEWSIAADYKYDMAQLDSLFFNADEIMTQFYQEYGTIPQRDRWEEERRIYLVDRFVQNACYYSNLDLYTKQRKHLTEFMLSTILK